MSFAQFSGFVKCLFASKELQQCDFSPWLGALHSGAHVWERMRVSTTRLSARRERRVAGSAGMRGNSCIPPGLDGESRASCLIGWSRCFAKRFAPTVLTSSAFPAIFSAV